VARLIAAGLSSTPPQLTGKGVGGVLEPVGAEVHDLAQHRLWTARQKALLIPGAAWSPWPLPTSVLMAIAVACIAYTLPVDLAVLREYVPEVPSDIDTSSFPALNAALAYITVAAPAHTGRQFASSTEPAPPIGVGAVKDLVVQSPWWIATFVSLMLLAIKVRDCRGPRCGSVRPVQIREPPMTVARPSQVQGTSQLEGSSSCTNSER